MPNVSWNTRPWYASSGAARAGYLSPVVAWLELADRAKRRKKLLYMYGKQAMEFHVP